MTYDMKEKKERNDSDNKRKSNLILIASQDTVEIIITLNKYHLQYFHINE